jgi:hypothetical protein
VKPEFLEDFLDGKISFVDPQGKKVILALFAITPAHEPEKPKELEKPEESVTQTNNTQQEAQATRSQQPFDKDNCTYKGIPLKGKVKVVTSFPDIKVMIVTSFPDIKVKKVTSFPDACGKWKFVESFPDFTIQYVTSFPDIKVQFVESFPGVK